MTAATINSRSRDNPLICILVLAGAAGVALASARSYAGGWNDGSRLATVESLVDYGTLVIDQSIFVRPPPLPKENVRRSYKTFSGPYPANELHLMQNGTGDKLYIGGHYYSDKSPVPALLMAGIYHFMQSTSGIVARDCPNLFCYWMTVSSSGFAYVVGVWCIFRMCRILGLQGPTQLWLTLSFGLATVCLPYVRHVNNHILLLAVAAGLMLAFARLSTDNPQTTRSAKALLAIGTLAGLGYTIDLGAGPLLAVCVFGLIVYRLRSHRLTAFFALGALPWLLLHHSVNYVVGGTFKPANAVPEYFDWPGCSFNSTNMTGAWNHSSIGRFVVYGLALLDGKRGFIGHNLALWLALPAAIVMIHRRQIAEWPEVICACCWSGGTWLAYAVTSTNYSGECCSIRWFVPLLGPGYFILAIFLREIPTQRPAFLILSAWGCVVASLMWRQGAWMKHMVPLYWPLQAAALGTWIWWAIRNRGPYSGIISASIPTNSLPLKHVA